MLMKEVGKKILLLIGVRIFTYVATKGYIIQKIFNYRLFDIYRTQALRTENTYYLEIVIGTTCAETSVTAVWKRW